MRRRIEKPRAIAAMIAEIRQLCDEVEEDYPWVYQICFASGGGAADVNISRGGTSDPTAGAIESEMRQKIRRDAARANGNIESARGHLKGAIAALARAQDRGDPRQTVTPTRYKTSATPEELSEYRKAQDRRRARGES